MTTRMIDHTEDIIDSRDILARIAALQDERETLALCRDAAAAAFQALPIGDRDDDAFAAVFMAAQTAMLEARETLDAWDADEGQELAALEAFAEQAENAFADWHYGEPLIRDSHFKNYAQDLADDLYGKELDSLKWPMSCIDWDEAADQLKQDYTSIEFQGVTYWGRS